VNSVAMPSPLGPQGPGRSDGRRSGSSGGRRPNPTVATADLARWRPSGRGAPARGAVTVSEPKPSETRVRSPRLGPIARQRTPEARAYGQASSADGRRRSAAYGRSPRGSPRRAATQGSKLPRLKAVLLEDGIRQRELSAPSARTDDERRCRAAPQAPRGGSRRPQGRDGRHRDVQANKRRRYSQSFLLATIRRA